MVQVLMLGQPDHQGKIGIAHARWHHCVWRAMAAQIGKCLFHGARCSRADTRLHEAFVENCGNPYIQVAYATAGAKIAALRTHLSAPGDVLHPRGLEQYKRLLELFDAGDFLAFEALMREHVIGTRDSYVNRLKARGRVADGV